MKPDIILEKPITEASYLDWCKGVVRQRSLKKIREASLEELQAKLGDDKLAVKISEALKNCREGYMRIQKQWPSLGEKHEGWTYIFTAGLSLQIDSPDEWYTTSIIEKIDWDGHTFTTLNSVYSFEFFDPEV